MEFIQGQYYWDQVYHVGLIFEEEQAGYYWFYCIDEGYHVAYYDFELENLRRY